MITTVKEKEEIKTRKKVNNLKKLEDFYINGTVEDLLPTINQKKEELTNQMIEYAAKNREACKWDKDGVPIDYAVMYNPIVVSNTFFKSIVPFGARIPMYNAEKLWLVFDYYMSLITEVNDIIGNFPPTLTGFAKFAGVSLNILKEYRNSADLDMRNVMNKIYDQIEEENLTFSQLGRTRERTTLFRMKSENELVEKVNPNVNITYKEVVNTDKINANLDKYKNLLNKKG